MKKDKVLSFALPVAVFFAIAAIWITVAKVVDSEYIFPSVSQTFSALKELLSDEEFYTAYLSTLLRSLIAFSVSFILAFIAALLSYRSENAERAIAPVVAITRALPTVAVVLLLTVWTTSSLAPIVVTTLVVFPALNENIFHAFKKIDPDLDDFCKVFNITGRKKFFKVILPQVGPALVSSCGAGVALNLKLMVAAEVLSQTARSLGYMLSLSKAYFETATMTALVVVTVITGLVFERTFAFFARKAEKGV